MNNRDTSMMRVTRAEYIASAVKPSQYPSGGLREFVFMGRSNVGKSSLINNLVQVRNLARVSGQPGKTQTINFFKIGAKADGQEDRLEFVLADLPGYGYAKTSKANRERWAAFIREYLLKRKLDKETINEFGIGLSLNKRDMLTKLLMSKGHSLEEIIADRARGKADFNVVVSQLHYYTALAVMTVVFALICTFAPSGKRKVKFQLPGAFFSSSAIIIFTMLFAMYANGKNIYSSFYGSLSSVAIFLLWIYSCINLFLMGCVINVRYEDKIKIFFSKLVLKK